MIDFIVGAICGLGLGAGLAGLWALWLKPRPVVHHIVVSPEAIARGIAAGGGIHCSTPPVLVDWSIIHRIVESEGYVLIGKDEPGAPRRH